METQGYIIPGSHDKKRLIYLTSVSTTVTFEPRIHMNKSLLPQNRIHLEHSSKIKPFSPKES